MTNQEMAFQLGRYIIKLQKKIAVLEGVFLEFRIDTPQGRREIPYRELAEKVSREEGYLLVENEQLNVLSQAIPDGTPDSALIRGLHRQFLDED
jgi:hypothetical protein